MDEYTVRFETDMSSLMKAVNDEHSNPKWSEFIDNDLRIIKEPKYREHPGEYTESVKRLTMLLPSIPNWSKAYNSTIELRTYLLKEMDIAQDFALEMIEDAREPEEVDECECE